jgi:hypothetical protein
MNKTFKNLLGITGSILAVVVAISVASYVSIYSKSIEPSSFRNFSVSAEGEAIGVPDVAEFTVSVITEGGMDMAALQEENTEKNNAITAYVKENGVEDEDINTSNYSLYPRYNRCYEGDCTREIIGYTINSSITVKVRDFTKAGEMLSGVVTKGANSVSNLTFKIDDPDNYLKEARDEAIAKAKDKAKELAKSAGFKVGRLLSISEGYSTPYYSKAEISYDGGMGGSSLSSIAPVRLEAGSQELTSTVTLTYEIK